jgi:hypothetical protein
VVVTFLGYVTYRRAKETILVLEVGEILLDGIGNGDVPSPDDEIVILLHFLRELRTHRLLEVAAYPGQGFPDQGDGGQGQGSPEQEPAEDPEG